MGDTRRIVITGAAGHLGSNLLSALLAEGFQVVGIDRVEKEPPPDAEYVCADLAQRDVIEKVAAGADVVVHCASIHPWKSYSDDEYLDSNITGTWHLYSAVANAGVDRVVLTSSISAGGCARIPPSAWPVREEQPFPLGDLYAFTKHAQEGIARLFADNGRVRTLALRPPAFMPRPVMETGFSLTGCFLTVGDVVSAHVAAVRLFCADALPDDVVSFEAIHVTNRLPYTAQDMKLRGSDGNIAPLVKKYWPQAYEWLVERGYQGAWLPAVYDLSKARRILGWEPQFNFEEWFATYGPGDAE